MRRWFAALALLSVFACGGEMIDDEPLADELVATDETAPAEEAASFETQAFCPDAPVECYCKSFKTQTACRTASPTCIWYYGRCAPAWE